MVRGKQVKLFLIDGTPGGPRTAEIMGWTGHVLKCGRDKLGEIRQRREAQRPGIYVLLGEDPVGDSLAYVGQSDNVGNRLAHHDAKKDFWTEVVIVTSKDENLTSAHVRYLEARLLRLAKSIGRMALTNGNEPSGGADLPESDAAYMDTFIDELRIVLPVLGVDLFRGREPRPVAAAGRVSSEDLRGVEPALATEQVSPLFHLRLAKWGVDAHAQVVDGEFTVLSGSLVSASMRASARQISSTKRRFAARSEIHARMMEHATSSRPDGPARLDRDFVFTSPSAAAAVVQGHATANGRTAWVTAEGMTYADWENRGIA